MQRHQFHPEIVWHPEFQREWEELFRTEPREGNAVLHAIAILTVHEGRIGFPHSSAVRSPNASSLRELRPRRGRSRFRVLYTHLGSRCTLLALAPEATVDQRRFSAAVARAQRRASEQTETGEANGF